MDRRLTVLRCGKIRKGDICILITPEGVRTPAITAKYDPKDGNVRFIRKFAIYLSYTASFRLEVRPDDQNGIFELFLLSWYCSGQSRKAFVLEVCEY